MATRTGSFGSSGQSTGGGTHQIGITMGAAEYPTRIEFDDENGYWYCDSNQGGAVYLYIGDKNGGNTHLLENFTREASGAFVNAGPWNVSGATDLCGKELALILTATNITFRNATTVTVKTNYNKYTITVNSQTHGSATASESKATPGTTITMTPNPNTGYELSSWTSSPTVTFSGNKFTMPSQNITVTPHFQKKTFTITKKVSPSGAGTITAATTANYGDQVSVSQTPATGYTFSGWTLSTGGTVSSGKFTMPAANVTLTATYTRNTYTITKAVSPTGGGTVTAPASAQYGETVSVSATPATGYSLSGWTLSSGGAVSGGKFLMPAENVTLTATFEKNTYTITAATSPAGAGTVTVAGTAQYLDMVSISQTPAAGYYFTGWTLSGGWQESSNYFTMPAQNVTVTANYKRRSTCSINRTTLIGGTSATMTINTESAAYTHKYRLNFGTGMDTGLVSVAAGTTSVSISIPTSWANSVTTATTKTGGSLTLETYSGTTKIGEYSISGLVYQVPADAKPTAGAMTTAILRTVDGVTYANIGNYYVQNHSGVTVSVAACTAKYSATIASIKISISGYSGNKYVKTFAASSASMNSGLLSIAGSTTITAEVTDSRGQKVTATATITVTAYTKPSIRSFTCWRVDNQGNADPTGEYAQYAFDKAWTQIGSNAVHTDLLAGGTTETDTAASGWVLPNTRKYFNILQSYTIRLTVRDSLESTTMVFILGSGKFMMHFSSDGNSVAFGHAVSKTPETGQTGTFEVDGSMSVYIGNMTLKDYILAVVNGNV